MQHTVEIAYCNCRFLSRWETVYTSAANWWGLCYGATAANWWDLCRHEILVVVTQHDCKLRKLCSAKIPQPSVSRFSWFMVANRWQRRIGETCTLYRYSEIGYPTWLLTWEKCAAQRYPANDTVDSWWTLHEDISHTAIPMWVGGGFLAFSLLSVFFPAVLTTWRQWSTAFAKFL